MPTWQLVDELLHHQAETLREDHELELSRLRETTANDALRRAIYDRLGQEMQAKRRVVSQ